ncbi:hypothetical protein GPJ56_009188 [Histomonas meleagridis]|uniref:uncharacterized protein n=1 Tax=Histomonas meleagridis TaxID=135588 RepID=UPI00355A6F29|nr:hypothetical protein GPJ56_009188 [Histomonas meleagridis]KAH0801560.1 hypothetical protein GO595_005559 [Histomonas meleagridis]
MLPDSIQDLQRILALTKEEAIENNSDTLQPLKSPIGSDSDFHISNDSIDKNVLPIQSKQIDNTSSDADYMDITQNESEDDVLQSSISLSESPIIKSKEQKSSSKSRFSTTSNNKLSNVSIDKQNQSIKSDLEEKSENILQLSSDLQSNKVSSEGSDAIIDEYVFDQSDNFSELNFESDENKLQTENEDLEILNEEEDFSDIDFSVSSGETPDLKGISLDVDQYLNQFEPKETIDIDEFVSN